MRRCHRTTQGWVPRPWRWRRRQQIFWLLADRAAGNAPGDGVVAGEEKFLPLVGGRKEEKRDLGLTQTSRVRTLHLRARGEAKAGTTPSPGRQMYPFLRRERSGRETSPADAALKQTLFRDSDTCTELHFLPGIQIRVRPKN